MKNIKFKMEWFAFSMCTLNTLMVIALDFSWSAFAGWASASCAMLAVIGYRRVIAEMKKKHETTKQPMGQGTFPA